MELVQFLICVTPTLPPFIYRRQASPATRRPENSKREEYLVALFEVILSKRPWALVVFQCSFHQSYGSVTFWYGSGSTDLYFWLEDSDPDPDPAFFVSDLQDDNLKKIKKISWFFSWLLLKLNLHHFPKIKSHRKVKKTVGIKVSLTFFAWW